MINVTINHQTADILPQLEHLDSEDLTLLLSHRDREAFSSLFQDHDPDLARLIILPETDFQYDQEALQAYAQRRQVTPRPLLSPGPHHGAHLGIHTEVAIVRQALAHGWPDEEATELSPEHDPEAFSDAFEDALAYLNRYVPRGYEFSSNPSMDYGVWQAEP